jgi:flagellar protein FliO/FliZ
MQFLTSLIGGSANLYINAALALGIVLALIVLLLWVLKLVLKSSSGVVRGRNKRLAVIDSLPVDGKRQLIIVRRDNVEHLILTGGPQDLLVETGFAPDDAAPAARPVPAIRRQAVAVAGPQRAPTPKRAMAAQVAPPPPAPVPLPANEEAPVRASLERLRDFGRAPVQRRPASIRHTGLMRSVGRAEPTLIPANTDNSAQPQSDSATTIRSRSFGGLTDDDGQDFGRDSDSDTQRDKQR